MNISHAQFVKVVPGSNEQSAEIEFTVQFEQGGIKQYTAILNKLGEDRYQVGQMFEKQAHLEIDWYENSSHEAYTNVSTEWANIDQAGFIDQIFKHGSVKSDLEAAMS